MNIQDIRTYFRLLFMFNSRFSLWSLHGRIVVFRLEARVRGLLIQQALREGTLGLFKFGLLGLLNGLTRIVLLSLLQILLAL